MEAENFEKILNQLKSKSVLRIDAEAYFANQVLQRMIEQKILPERRLHLFLNSLDDSSGCCLIENPKGNGATIEIPEFKYPEQKNDLQYHIWVLYLWRFGDEERWEKFSSYQPTCQYGYRDDAQQNICINIHHYQKTDDSQDPDGANDENISAVMRLQYQQLQSRALGNIHGSTGNIRQCCGVTLRHHIHVSDDEEFANLLLNAGESKLVVVDFTSLWSDTSQKLHIVYVQLAQKYHQALFLSVDVDKCKETAVKHAVAAPPEFILFRNRVQVDMIQGAHPQELEDKIRRHYGEGNAEADASAAGPRGTTNLVAFFDHKSCVCFNESDNTPFRLFLEGKSKLVSDSEPQLIMVYEFIQNVKLQAFKIKAPATSGPKNIKFFINQPKTLDFEAASSITPTEGLTLSLDDLSGEKLIELRFGKFQKVSSVQIFIPDNQAGTEETEIESFVLYGLTVSTTNMSNSKRVAGSKGESH